MTSHKPKGNPKTRGRPGPGGCAVCKFERRHAVDLALTYGQSARSVAEQFELPYDAVIRHKDRHLSAAMRASILTASKPSEVDVEALTKQEAQGLLAHLVAMRARLSAHAQACAAIGDHKGAIQAEKVTLADLELTAKLVGQLIARSEVVHQYVTLTPSYLRLREALLRILRPHPEIAAQIAAELRQIEADEGDAITAKASPPMIEHQPHAQ
jgi:hypothetical protein